VYCKLLQVVNTGHDTKVMMAMTKPQEKSSQLNDRINSEIRWVAVMLAVLCVIGAVGDAVWVALNTSSNDKLGGAWYLYSSYDGGQVVAEGFLQLAYYFLLLYGFIPISLYVTQNFVRSFQVRCHMLSATLLLFYFCYC
jgi:phospholipid-translocating ATPase